MIGSRLIAPSYHQMVSNDVVEDEAHLPSCNLFTLVLETPGFRSPTFLEWWCISGACSSENDERMGFSESGFPLFQSILLLPEALSVYTKPKIELRK